MKLKKKLRLKEFKKRFLKVLRTKVKRFWHFIVLEHGNEKKKV